jgi:hypothetical protein
VNVKVKYLLDRTKQASMEPHDETPYSFEGVHPSSTKHGAASIAASAQSCSRLFKECAKSLESEGLIKHQNTPPHALLEQGRRYELWAKNIAAAQPAQLPTSLEYRLRTDGNARKIVQKGLEYVIESLEMGKYLSND